MKQKPKENDTMNSRNIWDIERYVDWLETVLIPDLKESGLSATADDFEQCVKIIKDNVLNETKGE